MKTLRAILLGALLAAPLSCYHPGPAAGDDCSCCTDAGDASAPCKGCGKGARRPAHADCKECAEAGR